MTPQKIKAATSVPMAPRRAWDLYTTPDAVTRWNFATDAWHCPSASIDLKIGGVHNARMEAKDGSVGFDFEGVYTEIEAPHSLTLTLADGRKARTTFTPSSGGTVVETIFDADAENSADMQQAGWQAILDNYRKYAEQVITD